MNERIQELAEQANEEIMKNTPSFLVTNAMWKEKFAELIVRECMGIVEQRIFEEECDYKDALKYDPVLAHYSDCAKACIVDLKEHFGVE